MSIGTGIFLSSLLLAIVILYGITKDRWPWRRMFKRTGIGLLVFVVIGAAAVGALYLWNQLPARVGLQTEYAGLRIGMSPDEVMYVKGYPPVVLEAEAEGEWKGFYKVVQTKDLEKGKRVQDYQHWSYNGANSNINVEFDKTKSSVIAIDCFSNDKLNRCPPVAGLKDGDSEKDVIRKLGTPNISKIQGVAKSMVYSNLGITLTLTTEQVYMLSVNDPNQERF